jgi:hypothetical protein
MHSYIGSGTYCYANSLQMALLAASDNDPGIPSSDFIECLTTMPFGKLFLQLPGSPQTFFSNPHENPDSGLTIAIRTMGWSCQDYRGGDEATAVKHLREVIKDSPALAGPLNMAYLTYNPRYKNLDGVDHFVLILGVEGETEQDSTVRIHDPAGYPAVTVPLRHFVKAWKGERVGYCDEPYVLRTHFKRVRQVSREDMVSTTISAIRKYYAEALDGPVAIGGVKALQLTTDAIKAKTSGVVSLLAWFTLPLAARRCSDAAKFLKEAGWNHPSELMEQQALWHGKAQWLAAQGKLEDLVPMMNQLVELEGQLILAMKE